MQASWRRVLKSSSAQKVGLCRVCWHPLAADACIYNAAAMRQRSGTPAKSSGMAKERRSLNAGEMEERQMDAVKATRGTALSHDSGQPLDIWWLVGRAVKRWLPAAADARGAL